MPALQSLAMRASLIETQQLEVQLQTKLHRARIARRRDHAEVSRGDVRRNSSEVRVIEDIEHLRTQLQIDRLGEAEILRQREVHALSWWTIDDATLRIAHSIGND